MKKRFMSLVLAALMVFSMLNTTAFALDAEDIASKTGDIFNPEQSTVEDYELTLDAEENGELNLVGGTSLDNGDSPVPYSADSITNTFQGYITSQDEFSYVPVYVYEGSIVQATLVCPANKNLDYNLSLCVADADGYLAKIITSNLKTYIDPVTGKTVDEGISYVHNQATEGYLYVVVDSANGSSTANPFYLTVSSDVPGSYDSNEPNDSPFYATPLSLKTTPPISASVTGSLNVVNDQDWYMVTSEQDVVFSASAGSCKVEIYQVIADNTLGLADYNKSLGYYALSAGRNYFVKVYSDAAEVYSDADETSGSYSLKITDQANYTTMETAYDLGNWRYSFNRGYLTWGQSTAFYKFTLNSDDRIYVRLAMPLDGSVVGMVAFNSRRQQISNIIWSDDEGFITPSIGSPFLPMPIDGTQVSDGIVYIQVFFLNRYANNVGPTLLTRIRSGYGDFPFSGTCTNSGYSVSNTISLDLTHNSTIPEGCTVTKVTTKGSVSPSVGGVCHMVRPSSHDWLTPRSTSVVGQEDYINIPNNITAKQVWFFKYEQTAFASTKMTNITLHLEWDQDLQFNNYAIY